MPILTEKEFENLAYNAKQQAKSSISPEDYVILPVDQLASPYVNVSTIILNADKEPAEGATISVAADVFKHSTAQADGKVYLEAVERDQILKVNYMNAELSFTANELPSVVSFSPTMLDEVIIHGKKKSDFWYNFTAIGLTALTIGIVYKTIQEEKSQPQPIHL